MVFFCAFVASGASIPTDGAGADELEGDFPLQGILEVDPLHFDEELRKMVAPPNARSYALTWPAYGEFLLIAESKKKEVLFEWLLALRAVAPSPTLRAAVDSIRVRLLAEQSPDSALTLMEQLPPDHPARSFLSYDLARNLRNINPARSAALARSVPEISYRYPESQILLAELNLEKDPEAVVRRLSTLSPEWLRAPNRAHRLALIAQALDRLGVTTGAQILLGELYQRYPRYRKMKSLNPLLKKYGIPGPLQIVQGVIQNQSGRRRKNAMKKLASRWRNNRNAMAALAYGYGQLYFKQRDWEKALNRFVRADSLTTQAHLRFAIALALTRVSVKQDTYAHTLQWYTATREAALDGCARGCEFADALIVPVLGIARIQALELTGFHEQIDGIFREMEPYLRGLRAHPELLSRLGVFAYAQRDYQSSAGYFREILENYETSPGKDRLPWGIRAHHWLGHLAARAGELKEQKRHEDLLKRRWPLSDEADQLGDPSPTLKPVDWRRVPPPLPEDLPEMREAGFFILSGQLRLAKTAMESLLRRGKATPGLVAALAHTYLSLERPSQARHVINQFGGMLGSAPTESAAYLPLAFPIRFVDEVRAAAAVAGIPPEFLAAVVRHESNFNPKIKSWAGAIGLTQLMPRTAKAVAARHMPELSRARNRLRDPKINLQIGAFFLADLLKRYKGDEVRTLVAYNAGSGALYKSLKSAPKLPEEVQLDAIALRSAVAYARRVINARNIYRQIFGAELQRRQPTRPSQWSR